MKKINIAYWIVTGLMAAAILSTCRADAEFTKIVTEGLGFPKEIIPFLNVAKVLAVIAIAIPGFPRLKEWAYAGLIFDITGVTYMSIAKGGFHPEMLGMLIFYALIFGSYILHHKRLKAKAAPHA